MYIGQTPHMFSLVGHWCGVSTSVKKHDMEAAACVHCSVFFDASFLPFASQQVAYVGNGMNHFKDTDG